MRTVLPDDRALVGPASRTGVLFTIFAIFGRKLTRNGGDNAPLGRTGTGLDNLLTAFSQTFETARFRCCGNPQISGAS